MSNEIFNKLSKSQLQLIAAIAMLIDHTAVFAYSLSPMIYYIMRFIGRITIIIMCYFIVEGYHNTHNLDRYLIRMGIFAAIAQMPFYLYGQYNLPDSLYSFAAGNFFSRNVIFTLFVGLALITIVHSRYNAVLKLAACLAAFYITRNSDWGKYALLWILCFEAFYGNKRKQLAGAAVVLLLRFIFISKGIIGECLNTGYMTVNNLAWMLVTLGGFLALPLLGMYNHEKGKSYKLSFYVFYPAHLLILAILKMILFN